MDHLIQRLKKHLSKLTYTLQVTSHQKNIQKQKEGYFFFRKNRKHNKFNIVQ
ncbi:hypothetical protein Lalb_Chr09g0326691 [Lupinus albus]|uniref:Uncharacterized protein n=1 Tax=Lupinus albus TaxID=3870 RepID=A0A6A4Q0I2_LUPAL|nr:hypothetical protein Lalb_Chr09g0326691 [Lupinus albus]